MRKISVVISSLRPDRLEETIDTIACHQDLVEVVVVAPTPPKKRDFVRHIPVDPPGGPKELTFTQKFNLGTKEASCEYIVYNNDDIHFRPGWAPALLKHMDAVTPGHPYLAAFHAAKNGQLKYGRHTAFGLLYATHGCIRKRDLDFIGGQLFDDRLRMYFSDVDLGLRIWYAGGEVGICHEVVQDVDHDTDHAAVSSESIYAKEKTKTGVQKKTYRDVWYNHDCEIFFKNWYPRYFWLFFRNYSRLRDKFSNTDGVLQPTKYHSSLLKIMFWPVINMFVNPKIFFIRKDKMGFIRKHFVAVVNRRWGQLNYQLPYEPSLVVRKS